jgi:hypothetical protein
MKECLWCGEPFEPIWDTRQLYCKKRHKENARAHRRKYEQMVERCRPGCKRKIQFLSLGAAEWQLERLRRGGHDRPGSHAYQCPVCDLWHTSSSPAPTWVITARPLVLAAS